MELLPVELILSICDRLPQWDSCRLCSTCRRLLGILPRVVAGWRIEELVVKEPRLVHPDFVRRNLPALSRIVVIIDCFDRRFLPYVDYLGSLFDACDRVETLTIKSTLRFFDNSRNSKVVPILNKLLGLISKLSVKEIRVEPGLRKLILPPSVEKCRMDASCLANLNQPMDIPRRPADAGLFGKITSMSLYIRQRSGGGNIFKCGNLWENLSLFPALVDLSLRGSGPPRDMSENNNCPIPVGVRRLSLNVPLNTAELGFLSPLSNLEALSLGRLGIRRYDDGGSHPPMMWPPLLKELRVGGEAITDDCLLYRWLMDTGCDASPTLERIFVHFDATNWLATRFQTPALPSADYGRFRGDVLRNLSLLVNDVPTWRLAYKLLRSLETLDELWLLFAMEDGGQLIDRIKVDVAMYGTVSTRISRLRIADGNLFRDGSVFRSHPFHEWSFFILACFPDVDVYQLHTSAPVIADSSAASMAVERWNRNRMASSTLMLHVKWYLSVSIELLLSLSLYAY